MLTDMEWKLAAAQAANCDLRKQTREALAAARAAEELLAEARKLLISEGDPEEDAEMIARIDEALKRAQQGTGTIMRNA